MERHHEMQLRQALDQVWVTGSVLIRWDQFYLWTGVRRIAKKPWRDIYRLWEELCSAWEINTIELEVMSHDNFVVLRRPWDPEERVSKMSDLI
jgi:hypothetical protein